MGLNNKNHQLFMILFFTFLLIGTSFLPTSTAQTIHQNSQQTGKTITGQILFAPMTTTTTYLISNTGTVNHTWSSSYLPGEAVYWLDETTILRTIRLSASGAGAGGGVQKVAWDGTVLWEFRYYDSVVLSHHDIEPLPNGNVLMIAWESKSGSDAIANGRNPNNIQGGTVKPDHIIEVETTGPSAGTIVWEWHVWDHLIQDYDSSKANYGVVANHPELIDINFGPSSSDWLHCNSVDYNEEFDQILISCKNFDEIWIIDHSTTTAEAAGHTGGNSSKGGDLLYRWGNPRAYDRGTTSNQKLFDQHDTGWIALDCPGTGNILIFNNGVNRPSGRYSTIDEIIPPVDNDGNYYLVQGSAYGPDDPVWIYTANPPTSFYANYISGCQRLRDGNTLICDGPRGRFFEVTPEKVTVWDYTNPYPSPYNNNVFKIGYIYEDEPDPEIPDLDVEGSLYWEDIRAGEILHSNFKLKNIGGPGSLLDWDIASYPTWGTWSFSPNHGDGLTPEQGNLTIQVSIITPDNENQVFEGSIRLENRDNPNDFDVIPVYLRTPKPDTNVISFLNRWIRSIQHGFEQIIAFFYDITFL
ncbi:MAG: aryl-sulfate sulfotransferase [Candidatus Thermoplasmatota archaeon]|nr:aryl-sulfate sulfotransferase [Candidatus Thermoplasmatota archaeon]MBU1941032.1 aryl-sulfate sulfotransferase [Candidatus Thermoplasmatota archaeon]